MQFHMAQPTEVILTELVYFLFIITLSIYIFIKTNKVYNLTKHKGIRFFKNIFIYFSLAYLFRLVQIFIMFSREIFDIFFRPRAYMQINMLLITYFSTLAMFYVIFSLFSRHIKKDIKSMDFIAHLISLLSSLVMFIYRDHVFMLSMQIIILVSAVIIESILSFKKNNTKMFNQNKITYLLLMVFWIISTLSFFGNFIPREIRIPIYVVSIGIFLSIFLRVRKRLFSDGKKKGSS